MSEKDKLRELALLIAVGKLFSEQATFLTGELKYKPKMLFNTSVQTVDKFCQEVEGFCSRKKKNFYKALPMNFILFLQN